MADMNLRALLDGRLYGFALRNNCGEAVGFALYVFHFCTKSPQEECYLNELYVEPDSRGKGGGKQLLDAVLLECRQKNVYRITWLTEPENHAAIKLYEKFGQGSAWVRYKLVLNEEL